MVGFLFWLFYHPVAIVSVTYFQPHEWLIYWFIFYLFRTQWVAHRVKLCPSIPLKMLTRNCKTLWTHAIDVEIFWLTLSLKQNTAVMKCTPNSSMFFFWVGHSWAGPASTFPPRLVVACPHNLSCLQTVSPGQLTGPLTAVTVQWRSMPMYRTWFLWLGDFKIKRSLSFL